MKAYKRFKTRLTVGITALIVAMTSSSFRVEIGSWGWWVCMVACVVSYLALSIPIFGLIDAANSCQKEEQEKEERNGKEG